MYQQNLFSLSEDQQLSQQHPVMHKNLSERFKTNRSKPPLVEIGGMRAKDGWVAISETGLVSCKLGQSWSPSRTGMIRNSKGQLVACHVVSLDSHKTGDFSTHSLKHALLYLERESPQNIFTYFKLIPVYFCLFYFLKS